MTALDERPVEGPNQELYMRSFHYLADGHHVDDGEHLISCTYVDFLDPAERHPITTLQKASSRRQAMPSGHDTLSPIRRPQRGIP